MKKLLGLFLVPALCLSLAGCSNKVNDEIKDVEVAITEELENIEKEVVETVESSEEIAKEDIEKAISYIQENIDKIEDSEVAKNVVKAGAYLENLGKVAVDDAQVAEHELVKFGQDAKEHATEFLTSSETEAEKVLEKGKEIFASWEEKLTETKDTLVDDFHKLLHK